MATVVYEANNENNYIIIRPTENQTWNNWANTSEDNLTIGITSLKNLINSEKIDLIINITTNIRVDNSNEAIATNCIYVASDDIK